MLLLVFIYFVLQSEKFEVGKNLRFVLQSIPFQVDTLLLVSACIYCQAKRFYHEPKGFCCFDGEICLVSNGVPDDLYRLFTSNLEKSIEFLKYIRTFNNKFACTSFGVKYDQNFCKRNKGIYTYRVQGQCTVGLYHIMLTCLQNLIAI